MRKLEVRLTQQPGQERIVGQLAETGPRPAGGRIYFEHDPELLRDPLWLSPFKLPPQPGLIEHRDLSCMPREKNDLDSYSLNNLTANSWAEARGVSPLRG